MNRKVEETTMGVCAELRAKPPTVWKDWWKMEPEGFVYYIGCTETRRIKIGWTASCPYARMAQLQVGSPTQLVMLGALLSCPFKEKQLHRRFRREHVRGEWFHLSKPLCDHLLYVAQETGAHAPQSGQVIQEFVRLASVEIGRV